jgi:hypothetical protein
MRRSARAWVAMAAACLACGCTGHKPASESDREANEMDIFVHTLAFEAPDSTAAGWTTLRFHNESAMTHFAVVERLPEGVGVEEHQAFVAPVFQAGMDLLNAGRSEAAMAKFGELPEWFGKVVFMGGPGLTGPGRISQTTIRLEPGIYLLECYVKTAGVFHSYNADPGTFGMVHQFTVTAPPSPAPEPIADLDLSLSMAGGIEMEGEPRLGTQTVGVHFVDQAAHENFVGHDVHLVRLSEHTDMNALVAWMDWRQKTGLQTPAPATFLGGINEMPAGNTGYVTVTLEPGRYAWIAEVPNADASGFLKLFSLPADGGGGS